MIIAERRRGLPLSLIVNSARPGEILLAEKTIRAIPLHKAPQRLIGDKAYYSKPHRELFRRCFGLELIASPKKHYKNSPQDRRLLRRMSRRWKVERLVAWLKTNWRLRYRRERYQENYQGFLTLACVLIYLRHL
jgi:hypothetical protein